MSHCADQLLARGMSASEAERKASLFGATERALGTVAEKRWFVPGRIEVLGKHTDYAGGPSLLCAAERGFCVVAAARPDSLARVSDVVRGESVEVPLSAGAIIPNGWGNYVATVARRVARNFPEASRGVEIAFASDLPHAAGLSSSSALMIAIFTAIAEANRLCERSDFVEICSAAEDLAAYLACIENGQTYRHLDGDCGVGTFGGSEDHTAILCCRAGHVSQYRFCPTRLEAHIPLPGGWTFAIASSGVKASKTGAARELYNRASFAAKAVLEKWNTVSGRRDPTLDAAVRRSAEAPGQIRDALRKPIDTAPPFALRGPNFSADELVQRFEQFVAESQEIIPAAAAAFVHSDAGAVGTLVDRSQEAAEHWLKNQVPETVALARTARELGAIAASAFGAGFGGSVWALVTREQAADFVAEWRTRYARAFPGHAQQSEFFVTAAGPPLTAL